MGISGRRMGIRGKGGCGCGRGRVMTPAETDANHARMQKDLDDGVVDLAFNTLPRPEQYPDTPRQRWRDEQRRMVASWSEPVKPPEQFAWIKGERLAVSLRDGGSTVQLWEWTDGWE